MIIKYILETSGPRLVEPSITTNSYSRNLNSKIRELNGLSTNVIKNNQRVQSNIILGKKKQSPVFYVTCICEINGCINTNNDYPIVRICFWILFNVSVD